MSNIEKHSIYEASRKGDIERLRHFLDGSCAVNDPQPDTGMTLLHYACYGGSKGVVELLCRNPYLLLNCQDKEGCTPLHAAADRGNVNIVEILLSRGFDGSIKDKFRKTPLHYAACAGNALLVRMLLEKFPDTVACESVAGKTAYDLAVHHGYSDLYMYLNPALHEKGPKS